VPSPQHHADYPETYWTWLEEVPADERDIDGRHIGLAASWLAASAQAAESPVIAITHAFVIGWIVQTSLAAPADSWMTLAPANASLTTIDCSGDCMRLVSYNDTGHLPPD
jgi:broad specificity phosphatase PhoE